MIFDIQPINQIPNYQLSDLVGGTAWSSLVPGLQRALGDQDPQVDQDHDGHDDDDDHESDDEIYANTEFQSDILQHYNKYSTFLTLNHHQYILLEHIFL